MIRKNNCPEDMENSPEFLMVSFDGNGHPVETKPIKDPSAYNDKNGLKNSEIYSYAKSTVPSVSVVNKDVIRKLVIFFLRNNENLRQEIRQSNLNFQQIIQDIKTTDKNELNDSVLNSTQILNGKIESLGKWASLQNEYNQTIKKKLDALNIYFDEISQRMSQLKDVSLIEEKLEDVSLRVSNLTNEIAGTKTCEMETIENLKSLSKKISTLSQEIEDKKLVESEFRNRFSLIEDELIRINESILQNNVENRHMESKIEGKLNELDSLRSQTTDSINELYERQKQMKEDLLINQEKVSREIANDVLLKIKKMLKKPKRRQKKPQKARVIRVLKKNFMIEPFNKILIVTDRKNSVFGNILHESVRKINENSIFVVTENKTNETLLDNPVIEAIKKSDYVFIIGKHSLTEIKEISEKLRNKIKIVLIKRSLKYSIL